LVGLAAVVDAGSFGVVVDDHYEHVEGYIAVDHQTKK
jgi:hypothetical protein